MSITPIQNVVYTAVTQKASLSSVSSAAPLSTTSEIPSSVPASNALVQNISSKLIEASSLYGASLDLAHLNSQLNVAQSGITQISSLLQNLQSIALQISNGQVNSASLTELESAYASMYAQIDQIAGDTTFNGIDLLDGNFTPDSGTFELVQGSGSFGQAQQTTSIVPDLTAKGLFGSNQFAAISSGNAGAFLNALPGAQGIVTGAADNINALSNEVNFAMASIETAQANSFASTSVINEGEVANPALLNFASGLLNKPSSSASMQTSKLSDNLMKLLNVE